MVLWLILCVNLTGPQGGQIFGQTYSGCVCEGVYLMKLAIGSVDWIKQIALLMWVALIQSEGLNRTKRLIFPRITWC